MLKPFELSVKFSSSSEFIVSSKILKPILPVGVFVYWLKTKVWVGTLTKVPLTKYTPSETEYDAPVDVAFVDIADAKDSPLGINELFSGPDIISISAANNSPSMNVLLVLFTPDESYLTYIVKLSLSDSEELIILTIVAETPDVNPTILRFSNWSIYDCTVTPRYSLFNSTQL